MKTKTYSSSQTGYDKDLIRFIYFFHSFGPTLAMLLFFLLEEPVAFSDGKMPTTQSHIHTHTHTCEADEFLATAVRKRCIVLAKNCHFEKIIVIN